MLKVLCVHLSWKKKTTIQMNSGDGFAVKPNT